MHRGVSFVNRICLYAMSVFNLYSPCGSLACGLCRLWTLFMYTKFVCGAMLCLCIHCFFPCCLMRAELNMICCRFSADALCEFICLEFFAIRSNSCPGKYMSNELKSRFACSPNQNCRQSPDVVFCFCILNAMRYVVFCFSLFAQLLL